MIQHCAGDNIRSRSDSAKLFFFFILAEEILLYISLPSPSPLQANS